MRLGLAGFALCMIIAVLFSCISLPSASVGDPRVHGFVLLEGEATIYTSSNDPPVAPGPRTRIADIDAISLEKVGDPKFSIRTPVHTGRTWFSNLEPGTYRVREIHIKGDPNEFTYRLPDDADPGALTFSVGTGELVYLGYVEIFQVPHGSSGQFTTVRIALARNRNEFIAWEEVYDLYARTDWEPLLLRRMELTKH